ncbi:hypothetical protein HA42_03100 [Pantoea deleyi]|nr:hypothetical protein HA42_03100 [Pantoea deleyi]
MPRPVLAGAVRKQALLRRDLSAGQNVLTGVRFWRHQLYRALCGNLLLPGSLTGLSSGSGSAAQSVRPV